MKKVLIGGVSLALLLGACGSPNENEVSGNELNVNNQEVVNVNEEEVNKNDADTNINANELFKETDSIADEIRKLLAVRDYDTLKNKYASPSLLKQFEDGEFDVKEAIPNAVEIAGDLYELHHFNDLYNPDDEIVWYEVNVLNDFIHDNLQNNPDVTDEDLKTGVDDHEEALKRSVFRITAGAKYDVFTFGIKKDNDGDFKVSEMHFAISDHNYFKNTNPDMTDAERNAISDELRSNIENKKTLHEFHLRNYDEVKEYYSENDTPSDPFDL